MKKKAVGQFRNTVWDPLLIVSQIVAVQSVFYTTYGLLTFVVCSVAGQPVSVAQMFDAEVHFCMLLFFQKFDTISPFTKLCL